MTCDVLAIGAHSDDVELGVGATLLKLVDRGFSVAVLDLTRGEAASRGTVSERAQEAGAAAELLQVAVRENAGLPDGAVANTPEQRLAVIPFIRALRPRVILAHWDEDRHPDHNAAHGLVLDANFEAGVASVEAEGKPYRAPVVYGYHPYTEDRRPPQLVVDISEYFERKMEVLRCYRSQLHNPDYEGEETLASSGAFWEGIRTRAAYWGGRIGVLYGEALFAEGPLGVDILPGLGSGL